MRNQSKQIKDMDDREKTKAELYEMISSMLNTDEDGYTENNKETA